MSEPQCVEGENPSKIKVLAQRVGLHFKNFPA
jgi:hypothetical protein